MNTHLFKTLCGEIGSTLPKHFCKPKCNGCFKEEAMHTSLNCRLNWSHFSWNIIFIWQNYWQIHSFSGLGIWQAVSPKCTKWVHHFKEITDSILFPIIKSQLSSKQLTSGENVLIIFNINFSALKDFLWNWWYPCMWFLISIKRTSTWALTIHHTLCTVVYILYYNNSDFSTSLCRVSPQKQLERTVIMTWEEL